MNVFEVLREKLEESKSDWNVDYNEPIVKSIEIVNQVEQEYNKLSDVELAIGKIPPLIEKEKLVSMGVLPLPTDRKITNADRIRSMTDEQLAEFLSENTNCDCCNIQCLDKLNCPSMSSCYCRHLEWLMKEIE